jgi:hypothetical protein
MRGLRSLRSCGGLWYLGAAFLPSQLRQWKYVSWVNSINNLQLMKPDDMAILWTSEMKRRNRNIEILRRFYRDIHTRLQSQCNPKPTVKGFSRWNLPYAHQWNYPKFQCLDIQHVGLPSRPCVGQDRVGSGSGCNTRVSFMALACLLGAGHLTSSPQQRMSCYFNAGRVFPREKGKVGGQYPRQSSG